LIEGRPTEAVTIVDGWITSFMPPPAEVLIELSDLLCKHQQWTCAARVLAKASEGAATPIGLLPKVAQTQWIAGDTAAAITTLRRALTLAPQHPGFWTQLGMVLITAGHWLDALMAYATAHSLQPENRSAIVGRACAFRLLLGQRVITVKHGNIQARFALSGRSLTVDFVHMGERFYEEDELGHLARLVARGGVIADVGANLGNHAVYFLHALAPTEIHLFEPNPACVAVLKENLALNPSPARVQLHEKGVGETQGELFFVPHDDLNNSLVVNPETSNRKPVQIITLDDTLTTVNFLKIDVEGMELGVLAGAKRLIRECRPVIFIEVQNHNQVGFEAFLKESSYETAHAFKGGDYTNIIAVPV
jgi:FkbM family methyltransferase